MKGLDFEKFGKIMSLVSICEVGQLSVVDIWQLYFAQLLSRNNVEVL